MSDVRLTRYASSDAFLEAAQPWLMRDEAENSLILGIAIGIRDAAFEPREPPYFVTASTGEGVVACAVRSPPYPLAISRCAAPAALELIALDALARYPHLDRVCGPEPTVTRFAELWKSNGRTSRRHRSMRIYEIRGGPDDVARAPGRRRPVAEADLPVITTWLSAFASELGLVEPRDPADAARSRLAARDLYAWDDGEAVSIAGFGGKTPNGVRINLVYTPQAKRRRGYATACVTALTQMLIDRGNRYCCLYTDLADPVANGMYRRIGYRRVCDAAEYDLA